MVLTCKSAKDFLLGNPPKGLIKPMLLWTFTFYFLWYYLREIRKEEILFWVDSFIRKKERKRVIDILPAPKLPWFGHNCWFLQIFLRQDKSLYFRQCLRNYVGICILPGCIIQFFPRKPSRKKLFPTTFCVKSVSVADPEWFIPDPDPATNFLSSGSNPYYLSIFGNYF